MKDKIAFVNIDSYSWYGGSEANLEEMAWNIAKVINAKPGTIDSQPSQITLVTYRGVIPNHTTHKIVSLNSTFLTSFGDHGVWPGILATK